MGIRGTAPRVEILNDGSVKLVPDRPLRTQLAEAGDCNRLKLALHLGGTFTDIHGLAHCNERRRARADAGRLDNGDNLRRRDENCTAIWPDERDEKSKEGCENCRHTGLSASEPDRGVRDSHHPLDVSMTLGLR